MVTEETIQIEIKGKDVLTFRNYIRLLVSSNHDWVITAGNEERRFFVIDVGEARPGVPAIRPLKQAPEPHGYGA